MVTNCMDFPVPGMQCDPVPSNSTGAKHIACADGKALRNKQTIVTVCDLDRGRCEVLTSRAIPAINHN